MVERRDYTLLVTSRLKERNIREQSFSEVIQYSNRLLETLDYLQKEQSIRKLMSTKCEDDVLSDPAKMKSEELTLLMKYCALQNELAECHKKISDYAQQIIGFRNLLDEKDRQIAAQKQELLQGQISLKEYKELCRNYSLQLEDLKTNFQNKTDECDTLNITYSSLENKKNDLEIENNRLKKELLAYKSREAAADVAKTAAMETVKPKAAAKLDRKSKEIVRQASQEAVVRTVVEAPERSLGVTIPARLLHDFLAHDSEVNCVLWVAASPQLITAGADRKVKLWQVGEAAVDLRKCVRDCNSAIMSVDLDMEAGLLLCASCDFASRVWTVGDFTVRHTLTGHSGRVMSAKFLQAAENQIVSGSLDQTLKLWDLRRRVCVQTCPTGSAVNDVVSKGGHVVASGHANGQIHFWDVRTNSLAAHVACTGGITSLDLSRNGHMLLTSQLDNKLALIDIRKYKEFGSLLGAGFEVGCDWARAKFSPDAQHCCCGSRNGSVYVWSTSNWSLERELKGHSSPVIACSWSSCGSYMASCDSKRKCVVWSNK